MKIGFIGYGNMAQAIAKGLILNGVAQPANLFFADINPQAQDKVEKTLQINRVKSNQDLINQVDTVILAVKPHLLDGVLSDLDISASSPFFISIAAGVTNKLFDQYLQADQYLRVMPNLNAQVQESMTAFISDGSLSKEKIEQARQIFEAVGQVVEIPEEHLGIFTAISGSSPALAFIFIDFLSRAAVKYGMSKDTATQVASQAVLGSSKTVQKSDKSPWDLVDQVSSPGGVTSQGVLSLLKDDFGQSLIHSIDAMVEKSEDLGR